MSKIRFQAVGLAVGLLGVTLVSWQPMRCSAQGNSYSVFNKQYVGLWNSVDKSGWRSVSSFNADGTVSEGDQRYGTWSVDGNKLVIHFDGHPDVQDRYDLPPQDDVLTGRTSKGDAAKFTRRSATAPAATYAALAGTWDFVNNNDGHQATVNFIPSGAIIEDGKRVGYWQIEGSQLIYSFREHHEWIDAYELPPKAGVIHGKNILHHTLTLTQRGAGAAAPTGVATVLPAAATPAAAGAGAQTAAPAGRAAASGNAGYFGKTDAGMGVSEVKEGTKLALPPPVAPALTHAPGFGMTGVGAGAAGGSAAVSTPSATATPEASAAALTPVGKWSWHSGATHTLTDKGAILEDAKVVGQWKWLDKSKGTVQVQWTGGPYRAPMTYTLSQHGNHLSGKSPASGQEHTEDRIE